MEICPKIYTYCQKYVMVFPAYFWGDFQCGNKIIVKIFTVSFLFNLGVHDCVMYNIIVKSSFPTHYLGPYKDYQYVYTCEADWVRSWYQWLIMDISVFLGKLPLAVISQQSSWR